MSDAQQKKEKEIDEKHVNDKENKEVEEQAKPISEFNDKQANDKQNKEEEEQAKPISELNESIQQTNKENEETDTGEQIKKRIRVSTSRQKRRRNEFRISDSIIKRVIKKANQPKCDLSYIENVMRYFNINQVEIDRYYRGIYI